MARPTVALVGRPNVGKSSLFNKLVGRPQALVAEIPGLTRDWQEGEAKLGNHLFRLIDTAGFEEGKSQTLQARMWEQSLKGVEQADLILFVVDGQEGITNLDRDIADVLRAQNCPVLLVINKTDGKGTRDHIFEAFSLGLGDPVPISAVHNQGFGELYRVLAERLPFSGEEEEEGREGPLRIAIVGRPNAGKSTYINALLGHERLLTGPEAGITRDAIEVPFRFEGRDWILIDTAGVRKRARVVDSVEKMSVKDSFEAVRYASAVILLTDATAPLEKQDLTLADHIIKEGRLLVIGVTKIDLVEKPDQYIREVREQLEATIHQVKGLLCYGLSVPKNKGLFDPLHGIATLLPRWEKRISTGQLNRWLEHALEGHPPPMQSGRRLKIKYVTQVKSKPPSFVAFSNLGESEWPASYHRYLLNSLREDFDLGGIPLRLTFRARKNPYADKE